MSTVAAQIQFAAEFVTFLVAAAGLALVVLRKELTTNRTLERVALTIGFLATGGAAFGHGSLLLKGATANVVVVLRVAGIVGLVVGSIWWWRGGQVARRLLRLGLVVLSAAVVLEVLGAGRGSAVLLASGSIVIGSALVIASRRSVSARVAASAAGTLLLVVLVLSVALSAVLSSSTEHEELNRLQSRADTETSLAASSFIRQEGQTARIAAAFLLSVSGSDLANLAVAAGVQVTTPAPNPAATPLESAQSVAPVLAALGDELGNVGGFAYLDPRDHIVARSTGVDITSLTELAGSPLILQAACSGASQASIEPVRDQVVAVAIAPVCPGAHKNFIGMVLRTRPLNDTYLADRQSVDPSQSLTIVSQLGVAATSGPQPPRKFLLQAAQPVLANSSTQARRVVGKFYVAVKPIQTVDHTTIAALIVSAPTSAVFGTRDRLFRTLFLIALGGTLLALGLAVVIGDRITAGLRRLTLAAESIQRGDIGERSGITSDDEVGLLGAAFDSMADSIERQTTELQAAADDETRLRNRLEAVVAGMGDALIAVDGRGRITDFNQAAEELTGVSAEKAVGQPVDEVVMLVNEDGGSLGLRLRTPSPSRWGMLATAVHISGEEFPIAVSAGALRGPHNDLAGQVLVVRDLRREREVEQMKTEFLSRIGHELRTPLTGIMGYADILLRRSVPAERAQLWHEEILVAAKRLLRTVEMLEFFASSGAGRVLLRPEPLDVRLLIDGVVATWSERLQPPSAISRRVARKVPDVIGDRRWLALAIDELVDNAVKFSPGGAQVMVTATTTTATAGSGGDASRTNGHLRPESTDPAPMAVEISVSDRGKGMTPDEQATAFSEFVQGDSSDTRRFGGLGLGLSLVQRVVEGHGGTVRCSSTLGKGSTFTIVLPIAPMEPGPLSERRAPRTLN